MTKKSIARQARDSKLKDAKLEAAFQIKDNRIYDDIKEVYIKCAETLVGYASAVNELCVSELVPHMNGAQQQKVGVLAKAFKQDIDVFAGDLIKINSAFVDKTGGEHDLEKYIDTIGVVDQFAEFIGRCKGTLGPTFNSLASEVSVVVNQLDKTTSEETTLKQQQDPNVITDVEVREI